MAESQEFQSAGNGRRLKLFPARLTGPNSAGGVGNIIARSRDLVRNNPWAGAAIEKRVGNAIGTGIQIKQLWGTDEFKSQVKALFSEWSVFADADWVLEFDAMQALAWREWDEAGEVFIRMRSRRESDGLPVPMQVQIIESEQCPRDYWATASNGNQIRAGIEFTGYGKRAAYWMYRTHPGDRSDGVTNATELVRIPADQVRHLYRPLRAGQIRGIPLLAASLIRAFNLDKLDDAVLERQKIGNLFTGFFTRGLGASDGSVLGETVIDGVDGADVDGAPIAGLEPATMQELPPGVDVKFTSPPGAGADYPEYMRFGLMAFAARAGVPYEVLTGDLKDVSDRALKLILNEFRRLLEMDQWLYFIPQFCKTVRGWWFDAAILSGKLTVNGYSEIRAQVIDALYVPQGWPYSHPVQDVTADIKAIEAGLVSRSATILSNGDDPEQVDEEQAADRDRAAALGLNYSSSGGVPMLDPTQQQG